MPISTPSLTAEQHSAAIRAFLRAQRLAVAAAAMAVVAMMRYPGGTVLEHDTARYRITQNFLSDLGMTVAYDGISNRLGAALFVASLAVVIVGFGSATLWFMRLYSATSVSRGFAKGAVAVGLLVCLSFIGVGLTPENAAMDLHVQFTLFAFRIFPIACLLLSLAAWTSGVAPARALAMWAFATISLTAYVAFLSFGAPPTTPDGLVGSVMAQKAVVVSILGALTFLCHDTARHLRSVRSSPIPTSR